MTQPSRLISFVTLIVLSAICVGDVAFVKSLIAMDTEIHELMDLISIVRGAAPLFIPFLVYGVSVALSGSRWNGLLATFIVVAFSLVVSTAGGFDEGALVSCCILGTLWCSARWYERGELRWVMGAGLLLGFGLAVHLMSILGAFGAIMFGWRGGCRFPLVRGASCSVFIGNLALGWGAYHARLTSSEESLGRNIPSLYHLLPLGSACLSFSLIVLSSFVLRRWMILRERSFSICIMLVPATALSVGALCYPIGWAPGAIVSLASAPIAEMLIALWYRSYR